MPLGDTRARLVLGEAGGNGPRDLQKGASPSSIPSNSGLSRLVGKWTPPPGPWFSGLHNEELLWQQVRREGSLGFSPSTLSIPPPPSSLACLPGAINGELALGRNAGLAGAPQHCTLRERPAPGLPAASLSIYIASGNPIQPAPALVFRHPAPAQAGPVASPSHWHRQHSWLGVGGATGPQGENMSWPGGAGPGLGPPSVPSLSLPVPGSTFSAPTLSPANLAPGKA